MFGLNRMIIENLASVRSLHVLGVNELIRVTQLSSQISSYKVQSNIYLICPI